MKPLQLRRSRTVSPPGLTAVARLDRRSAALTARVLPGEIAVIQHLDLDRGTAEALVGAGVAAVINQAPSVSGRYPNLGPQVVAAAGIPLVDVPDADVFSALRDGDRVRLDGSRLFRGERLIAEGELLDASRVDQLLADARSGRAAQLEAFTFNTVEHLRRDQHLLLDGAGVPDLRTRLDGRQVVIACRSYDYRSDLRCLRTYIREHRPVLVGVDAGADALVEAGHAPDLIVGDLDAVSDRTLRRGAELVTTGQAASSDRLHRLGVSAVTVPASGTSEDAAMLLADTCGAALIVTAGSHVGVEDFLDRGQSQMAGSFLTRLRVGPRLVDAKVIARLNHNRVRSWQLALLVCAGLLAVLLAIAITPAGEQWLATIADGLAGIVSSVQEGIG